MADLSNCPKMVDLLTRIERLERTVSLLVATALDAARRELSPEQLCQVRAAAVQAGVETVSRIRAAAS